MSPTVADHASAGTTRTPIAADPAVRCCARDALRNGADPIEVAALLGVCVEDLDDILEADWP